jgi:hypothetical protein
MRILLALVVALAAPPAVHAACPAPPSQMRAAAFEQRVASGKPVRVHDTAIRGRVEVAHARAPITCRRCSFDELVLRDAVVERTLDLSDLRGVRLLDLRGAAFRQPVLLGVDDECEIARADFELTTFDDVADLEEADFGDVTFSQARFRGPTDFARTTFAAPARFLATRFAEEVRFDGAVFERQAGFAGATFGGRAQFLGTQFAQPEQLCEGRGGVADFTSATFSAQADFGQGQFCGEARFQRTRFDGDASFLGAQFLLPKAPAEPCDPELPPDAAATFDHVSADGRLDFGAATFGGTAQFLGVSAPVLSLDGTTFGACVALEVTDLGAVEDLRLAPDDTGRVSRLETRIGVLRVVEASAKARDDLAVANEAHYRLQELASEREGAIRRFLDHVFYRGVAGYFVRPLRPLACLLVLAVLASLLRTFRPPPRPAVPVRRRLRTPGRRERATHAVSRFVTELGITLSPRQRAAPDAPLYRKLEGAVYAVLLVCFAIGLANSNPTLKQLVDALL